MERKRMFNRMKDLVKNSIEAARATLMSEKADHQSAEQILATEIAVLERHSSMVERLASARTDTETMSAALKTRYSGDCIPQLAHQLSLDSTRIGWLASELAAFEATKANLPRILVEYRRCTIDAFQSDLDGFEKEHRIVLKKHGAIN